MTLSLKSYSQTKRTYESLSYVHLSTHREGKVHDGSRDFNSNQLIFLNVGNLKKNTTHVDDYSEIFKANKVAGTSTFGG